MRNSIKQVRVCLEEIGDVVNNFWNEIIEEFHFKNTEKHTCEVQHRGIGINFAFDEEIHRSDDEIMYYLMDDKLIGCVIIRRTEFNHAEITMITTEERFKEDKK